jgi:RNA polymerase sigma factor (sigma-70 family)
MERCRRGDGRAWEELVNRYERLVFSIPLNYGLSREDAADVAQIVFTHFMQNLDTGAEIERLGPYLATMSRRHTWRLFERSRREGPGRFEDVAESGTLAGRPDADAVELWETTQWLHDGLGRLNEPCRELLLALYLEPGESSYAEVAQRLGRPVGSIGPMRARCLGQLQEVMSEERD